MLVKTYAAAVFGVDAITIVVEINAGGIVPLGKIGYYLVGLPDNAIKEGHQRIEAALKNEGFTMPRMKLIINLAPADIKKEGSAYDLPIAIGILAATKQISAHRLDKYLIMGELALDGKLRPIKGTLPIAICAAKEKFKGIVVPKWNAHEAAIVDNIDIIAVETLKQAVDFLTGNAEIEPLQTHAGASFYSEEQNGEMDFADVRGQENIKRALEIAAAGGHNAILIGPPGAGKTMLAQRLPGILPPLSLSEALETTKIHSVSGTLSPNNGLIRSRPFRAPHHTVSDVALVGGGSNPSPGEISLAHNGVLFLDELPEFKRSVLEVLRQPMEARKVTISRAKISIEYPSSFMLIASMNPCPCGFYNHPEKECVCGPGVVKKYLNRISGPLLDRIDLHVEVTPVKTDELLSRQLQPESSTVIRQRVMEARRRQQLRFSSFPNIYCNAQMNSALTKELCKLNPGGHELLKMAMEKLQLSARAYERILKVALTIADLAGSQAIANEHLAEAIHYRSLDREGWAG